jgi:hypothetical protein
MAMSLQILDWKIENLFQKMLEPFDFIEKEIFPSFIDASKVMTGEV